MGIEKAIYLFSKTPFEGVRHIPIIQTNYLHVTLDCSSYDLIVITSKEAVNALEALQIPWQDLPVIAISKPTADFVRMKGGHVLDIAEGYGNTLYDLIVKKYGDKRLLYPCPRVVASDFVARLQEVGIAIEEAVVYETHCNEELRLGELEEDAVLAFTSPSSVACFLKQATFLPTQKVAVIGTTTQKALPLHVKANLPKTPSVEALVLLAKKLQKDK